MADEAAIRIVIVDEGQGQKSSGPPRSGPGIGPPGMPGGAGEAGAKAAAGGSLGGAAASAAAGFAGARAAGAGSSGGGRGTSGDANRAGRGDSDKGPGDSPLIGRPESTAVALRSPSTFNTRERLMGHSEPWASAVADSILRRTSAGGAMARAAAGEGATAAGMATGLAAGAMSLVRVLTPVGIVAGTLTTALLGLEKVVTSSTRGYEELNAKIAAGRAQQNVIRQLSETQRAGNIADNLVRFENSMLRLETVAKDIGNKILNGMLGIVNGPLEELSDLVATIAEALGLSKTDAAKLIQSRMEEFLGMRAGQLGVLGPLGGGIKPPPADPVAGRPDLNPGGGGLQRRRNFKDRWGLLPKD